MESLEEEGDEEAQEEYFMMDTPDGPTCALLSGKGKRPQGAASSGFRRTLFLLVKKIKPDLVGLLEPRISGNAVDKACKSFGFEN
nr:uncharacterized protein LOC109184303 [Ipomoea batatas]